MEPIWLGIICSLLCAAIGYIVGRSTAGVKHITDAIGKGSQALVDEALEAQAWHHRVMAGDLFKPDVYAQYAAYQKRIHAQTVEITERAAAQHAEEE